MSQEQALENIVSQEDALQRVIVEIRDYPEEAIPLPYVAKLLNIDQGTLNARMRREKISKTLIGRTNYISKGQADSFAQMNAAAIRGWKTVYDLAYEFGKEGPEAEKLAKTLAYLCREKRIKGEIDLTKRWRISPTEECRAKEMIDEIHPPEVLEFEGNKYYSLARAARDAAALLAEPESQKFEQEFKRLYKRFFARIENNSISFKEVKGSFYFPELIYQKIVNPDVVEYGKRTSFSLPKVRKECIERMLLPTTEPLSTKETVASKPSTVIQPEISVVAPQPMYQPPTITLVSLPKLENQESYAVSEPSQFSQPQKKRNYKGPLEYDPDHPPSIAECVTGRGIRYGGRTGTILKLIESDGFRPRMVVNLSRDLEELETLHLIVKSKFAK